MRSACPDATCGTPDSGRSALLLSRSEVQHRLMPYYGHDNGGTAAWWWMLPMMLVFVIAVAAVLWAVLRQNHAPHVGQIGPEEVLVHRLARGEIDASEYHERLDALRKTPR
jgi:uncharacterized membrane protein